MSPRKSPSALTRSDSSSTARSVSSRRALTAHPVSDLTGPSVFLRKVLSVALARFPRMAVAFWPLVTVWSLSSVLPTSLCCSCSCELIVQ